MYHYQRLLNTHVNLEFRLNKGILSMIAKELRNLMIYTEHSVFLNALFIQMVHIWLNMQVINLNECKLLNNMAATE